VVDAAAKSSAESNRAMNKQQTEDLLSKLKDAGMTIIEPDLAPFQEATSSVAESYRNTYGTMLDDLNDWLSNYTG
ncbi:MAG: C4-dicarboxylate ABC transporter substrate-binding protein, partial [Bacillota bacterium]